MRCGRCCRAYVGVSANGNGGAYHYYACSGRQKLGSSCDGQRINRDKLENAVLSQLADVYQDGTLVRQAIKHLSVRQDQDRAALIEQRSVLTREIQQAERALDRYHQAFESGKLGIERFAERVFALDSRLETLRHQDADLAQDIAARVPSAPDTQELAAVAQYLNQTTTDGDPQQTKALLRLLIAELKVNSRQEIQPTYRIIDPSTVCIPPLKVGDTGLEPVTPSMSCWCSTN